MNDDNSQEQWHLSKSVSITQILSIVLLAIGLMTAWNDVQNGVNGNSKDIEHLREIQRIQTERTQEIKSDISERLERFERKLDKLIQTANKN